MSKAQSMFSGFHAARVSGEKIWRNSFARLPQRSVTGAVRFHQDRGKLKSSQVGCRLRRRLAAMDLHTLRRCAARTLPT